MNKYTVDYFIEKFSAIPASKWTTGNINRDGKCCALGFCGVKEKDSGYTRTRESRALTKLLGNVEGVIWELNDGNWKFDKLAKTPKNRVLKALKLVKEGKFNVSDWM